MWGGGRVTGGHMSTELERLAREQYILLTTFRKNGEGVSTPIWLGADDGELVVWTPRDSWKVKRLRRDPRVEVTACDFSGKKTHGATVTGTGRLLDDEGSDRVRSLIRGKYGIMGWISVFGSILRGGKRRTIGVAIELDD